MRYVLLFSWPYEFNQIHRLNEYPSHFVKANFSVPYTSTIENLDSLYNYLAPHHQYNTRIKTVEILKKIALFNHDNKHLWDSFKFDGYSYAYDFINLIWGALEKKILHFELLLNWYSTHKPTHVTFLGFENIDNDLQTLIKIFFNQRQITYDIASFNDILPLAQASPTHSKVNDYTGGVHPFMKNLGKELFTFYYAVHDPKIKPPLEIVGNLLHLKTFTEIELPMKSNEGFVIEATIEYLYSSSDFFSINIVVNQSRVELTFRHDGIYNKEILITPPLTAQRATFRIIFQENCALFQLFGSAFDEKPLIVEKIKNENKNYVKLGFFNKKSDNLMTFGKLIIISDVLKENVTAANSLIKKYSPNFKEYFNVPFNNLESKKIAMILPTNSHAYYYEVNNKFVSLPLYYAGFSELLQNMHEIKYYYTGASPILNSVETKNNNESYLNAQVIDKKLMESTREESQNFIDALVTALPTLVNDLPKDLIEFLKSFIPHKFSASFNNFCYYSGMYQSIKTNLISDKIELICGPRIDTNKWAAYAAHSLNKPAVSCEISFLLHAPNRLHLLQKIPEHSSNILIWGNHHLQDLQSNSLDSKEVEVSGNLSLDFYKAYQPIRPFFHQHKEKIWQELGFSDIGKGSVILFASSLGSSANLCMDIQIYIDSLKSILEAIEEDEEARIVIKTLALYDDPILIHNIIQSLNTNKIKMLTPKPFFHNVLYLVASDIVISTPTTLIAETLATGTPTIIHLNNVVRDSMPFSKAHVEMLAKIAPTALSDAEMIGLIKQVLAYQHSAYDSVDEKAMEDLFGSVNNPNFNKFLRSVNQQ